MTSNAATVHKALMGRNTRVWRDFSLGVDDVSYFGDCSFSLMDRRFCDVQECRAVDSLAGDLRGDIVGATPDYRASRLTEVQMFLYLAIVLAILWVLSFVVVHVAPILIKILLILAVVSLIIHLIQGRRPTVP